MKVGELTLLAVAGRYWAYDATKYYRN